MKTICFYFQIHQPFRLKPYRFFNIGGGDHYYYDDYSNEEIIQRMAAVSYMPANRLLLEMIKNSNKKFKVAFSISGTALEQLEINSPEVIDGLKELMDTGCVEFLAETYAHSLASLGSLVEFKNQVALHSKKIEELFGKKPRVFRNTELLYSDEMAQQIYDMGYSCMVTEGTKRALGWKSPNYLYQSAGQPKLKILLRNPKFSEDICHRFSDYSWNEYPLTAEKYIDWIASTPHNEQVINLFMNYGTFGGMQSKDTGIFSFMKALPRFAAEKNISFSTPSEIFSIFKPVDTFTSSHPITWADDGRDTSSWLGNTLQQQAFEKLYENADRVRMSGTRRILQDWLYLQASDHFYYMGTQKTLPFSPYSSPYDAFNNYMNVLSDFKERVDSEFPSTIDNEELNSLLKTIHNQSEEIDKLEKKVEILTKKMRSKSKTTTKKST